MEFGISVCFMLQKEWFYPLTIALILLILLKYIFWLFKNKYILQNGILVVWVLAA